MARFWIIAPHAASPAEAFEKVWEFDLANNVISIGWPSLGNVLEMSKDELSEAVAENYPDHPSQTKSLITNMLWGFYREVRPGDTIIARRGRKILGAVGKVTKSAFWSPNKNPSAVDAGFLEVDWQSSPRDKKYPGIVFPMHTLMEISAEEFDRFLLPLALENEAIDLAIESAAEISEAASVFVLEKYLEEFIVSNFSAIFQNQLKIYKDAEGNDGQQYTTDIGPIDILAEESSSNSFVVIELKKGRPSDQVVGQILRYMGWVKENLCKQGQNVKGLIICKDQDKKLTYALSVVNNISVQYYAVSFSLRSSPFNGASK